MHLPLALCKEDKNMPVRKVIIGVMREQVSTVKDLSTLTYNMETTINGKPLTNTSSDQ